MVLYYFIRIAILNYSIFNIHYSIDHGMDLDGI